MLNLDDRETAQPVKYGWTDRMFSLTSTQRYFLFNGAVDMRKGFDGLCRTRWDMMIRFPADGLYILLNRPRPLIKLLHREAVGLEAY